MRVMSFFSLFILSGLLSGCLESSFKLSEESRFPVWLEVPGRGGHEDYIVTLDYYTRGKAVFSLIRKKDRALVDRIVGRVRDGTPLEADGTSWPMGTTPKYPLYTVVTYEGISEVMEGRGMEPVFYVTDSPNVLRNLGCSSKQDQQGYSCQSNFIVRE